MRKSEEKKCTLCGSNEVEYIAEVDGSSPRYPLYECKNLNWKYHREGDRLFLYTGAN